MTDMEWLHSPRSPSTPPSPPRTPQHRLFDARLPSPPIPMDTEWFSSPRLRSSTPSPRSPHGGSPGARLPLPTTTEMLSSHLLISPSSSTPGFVSESPSSGVARVGVRRPPPRGAYRFSAWTPGDLPIARQFLAERRGRPTPSPLRLRHADRRGFPTPVPPRNVAAPHVVPPTNARNTLRRKRYVLPSLQTSTPRAGPP